jgi:hypothetical protein
MKPLQLLTVVTTALAMSLLITQATWAQTSVTQINRNLPKDPLILNGKSGGVVTSNCGKIPATPNHVIQVTESLPYLRLTVESQGKPTLLIDGPGGRFCVLADSYSGGKPELAGFWQVGTYSLYIGESSKDQHNYTLSISQQKQPTK